MRRRCRIADRVFLSMAACAAIAAVDGGIAGASDPFALYGVPVEVDMLPSEVDATRVVIHGAFLFLSMTQGTSAAVYTDPRCGKMYFACPAGEETLCRMQWQDLRNAVGRTYCAGFGTMNMLSTATLLDESAPLTEPDAWEMGMGVAIAGYLGGQCPKATALSCAGPPKGSGGAGGGSAGAGGAIVGGGGASGGGGLGGGDVGGGVASGAGGTSTSGGAGGAVGIGGQLGARPAGAGGSDGGNKTSRGCAVGGAANFRECPIAAALATAIVVGAMRRRRRRDELPPG